MNTVWSKIKNLFFQLWQESEWIWFGLFVHSIMKLGVGSWLGILCLIFAIWSLRNALSDLIQAKIDENFSDENDIEQEEIETVETMISEPKKKE